MIRKHIQLTKLNSKNKAGK